MIRVSNFLLPVLSLLAPSLAFAQTEDKVVGFGLGISSGTVLSDTGSTSTKYEIVSYSAIAYSAFTNFDVSPSISTEVGGELLILLSNAKSNQSVAKTGYGAVKYHILGGSHAVSSGSKTFNITKSSSLRVSIPAYLKYDSIDFSVETDGAKTTFTGALLEIATGIQTERDFGNFVLGGTITKTVSTVLISSKSIKIDALSLILSGKIYF